MWSVLQKRTQKKSIMQIVFHSRNSGSQTKVYSKSKVTLYFGVYKRNTRGSMVNLLKQTLSEKQVVLALAQNNLDCKGSLEVTQSNSLLEARLTLKFDWVVFRVLSNQVWNIFKVGDFYHLSEQPVLIFNNSKR